MTRRLLTRFERAAGRHSAAGSPSSIIDVKCRYVVTGLLVGALLLCAGRPAAGDRRRGRAREARPALRGAPLAKTAVLVEFALTRPRAGVAGWSFRFQRRLGVSWRRNGGRWGGEEALSGSAGEGGRPERRWAVAGPCRPELAPGAVLERRRGGLSKSGENGRDTFRTRGRGRAIPLRVFAVPKLVTTVTNLKAKNSRLRFIAVTEGRNVFSPGPS